MLVKKAEFKSSSTQTDKCPKPDIPEFAFIGRSNVGKSSLINMLTNHSKLAKISGKPGKTRLINHFLINDAWYMVDLPGYGYAKVSKTDRKKWGNFTERYLLERENLINTFVLIDSRIPPQKNDLEFMEFLGMNQIPFAVVFTKTDKLSGSQLNKNMQKFKNTMLKDWEELPPILKTSAKTKFGREAILQYIEKLIPLHEK